MPLRVTIDLIPLGIEKNKKELCVLDIENDGTGTNETGNYEVKIREENMEPSSVEILGFKRSLGFKVLVAKVIEESINGQEG